MILINTLLLIFAFSTRITLLMLGILIKDFSVLRDFLIFSILVEMKKHGTYPLVFRLVKFALRLPVAAAMSIKTDFPNQMNDEWLFRTLYRKKKYLVPSPEVIMNKF